MKEVKFSALKPFKNTTVNVQQVTFLPVMNSLS